MAITTPVPIPAGPPVPNSNDPEITFDAQFEASLAWQRNELAPKANALANASYDNALDAEASATAAAVSEAAAAQSATFASNSANFKGDWASLSGPLSPPASVWHNGRTWNLLSTLANVALSEPVDGSAYWRANDTVFPVITVNTPTYTMTAGYEYSIVYSGATTGTMPTMSEGAGVVITVANGRRDNVLLRKAPTDSFMGKTPDDITINAAGRFALRALANSWRGF